MTKKQRIRYETAAADRRNVLGAARTSELTRIYTKYDTNLTCIGGIRPLSLHYSGADYWV